MKKEKRLLEVPNHQQLISTSNKLMVLTIVIIIIIILIVTTGEGTSAPKFEERVSR